MIAKRISFNCPIPHISDTFYILYTLHKGRVEAISKFSNLIGMGLKATLVLDSDETYSVMERNSEDFRRLREEFRPTDISQYLMDDPSNTDEHRHLPKVINLPLKIYKTDQVQENGFGFKVVK